MAFNQPKISIVIVTFQAEEFIQECLLSISVQSYKSIEVIVVDGGSSDHTMDIVRGNGSLISNYISEPDKGIYDAMNKALAMTSGDFILFLGADDTLSVNLNEIIPYLKDPQTIYYGDVKFKQSGLIYDGEFNKFKLAIKNICHQSIFYPAKVFKNFQYEPKYKLLADHALNIQLFGSKEFRFIHMPIVVATYNQTGISGVSFDKIYIEQRLNLIYKNLGLLVYLYAKIRSFVAKFLFKRAFYLQK